MMVVMGQGNQARMAHERELMGYWSDGGMECWVEKNSILHYSITPTDSDGQITPLARREEIAAASYPKDLRISSVCSPSIGGA